MNTFTRHFRKRNLPFNQNNAQNIFIILTTSLRWTCCHFLTRVKFSRVPRRPEGTERPCSMSLASLARTSSASSQKSWVPFTDGPVRPASSYEWKAPLASTAVSPIRKPTSHRRRIHHLLYLRARVISKPFLSADKILYCCSNDNLDSPRRHFLNTSLWTRLQKRITSYFGWNIFT